MLCGWETVKHCMISYCCLASGFSESTSSGGLLSIRQLNVWLFLRPGSCGHGTPFTGRRDTNNTNNTTCWVMMRPFAIGCLISSLEMLSCGIFHVVFILLPTAPRVGSSTLPGHHIIIVISASNIQMYTRYTFDHSPAAPLLPFGLRRIRLKDNPEAIPG